MHDLEQEPISPDVPTCIRCKKEVETGIKYCKHCGAYQHIITVKESSGYIWENLRVVLFYYFPVLAVLLFASEIMDYYAPSDHLILDIVFSIFTLLYALAFMQGEKELFSLKKIKLSVLKWLVPLAVSISFVLGYIVEIFNEELLGEQLDDYLFVYRSLPFPLFFMLLSIAVQPAIFEEIAFRGFIFSRLKKVMILRNAMLVSSFAFAILHLSIFSIPWLASLGFFYCFLRNKYGTIYYGMIAHFFHNATVVIVDYYNVY